MLGVKLHHDKASLMGYQFGEMRVFLQVFVSMPTMIPTLKRILEEDGVELPDNGTHTCPTFESNVPFVLRYMIDSEINVELAGAAGRCLHPPSPAQAARRPQPSSKSTQSTRT